METQARYKIKKLSKKSARKQLSLLEQSREMLWHEICDKLQNAPKQTKKDLLGLLDSWHSISKEIEEARVKALMKEKNAWDNS